MNIDHKAGLYYWSLRRYWQSTYCTIPSNSQ